MTNKNIDDQIMAASVLTHQISNHQFKSPSSAKYLNGETLTVFAFSNGANKNALVKPGALEYISGSAGPQPLRISRSLAMAEFSVKSFALFVW